MMAFYERAMVRTALRLVCIAALLFALTFIGGTK